MQVNRRRYDEIAGTDRLALPALARAHDRVADLRRAVAVLEGRAMRCDVRVPRDRRQEVVELVDERVAPADDVAGRPPVLPEGMVSPPTRARS